VQYKVLVVEDVPILRMMAVDLVADAGFEVFEADNAPDAILILETTPGIRILFTDIDMPRSMNRLMLAAAARDRWPPIQIIVTSGMRAPTDQDMPERSEFFSKPYDARKLTAELHRMAA
jgi:CheY-like chemotaxis protein